MTHDPSSAPSGAHDPTFEWEPKAAGSDAPGAASALFTDRDDKLPRTIVAIVMCLREKFPDRAFEQAQRRFERAKKIEDVNERLIACCTWYWVVAILGTLDSRGTC
jgi:hypothetical protein